MNSIIKTVSFETTEKKTLDEKLRDHLGVQEIAVTLKNGETHSGIITELGNDYISLLREQYDIVIPKKNILYFKYQS